MKSKSLYLLLIVAVTFVGCSTVEARKGERGLASGSEPINAESPDETALQRSITTPEDMEPVYFNTGSAELRADAKRTLKKNADYLKSHPNIAAQLSAHCDERGSISYNQSLGMRRASAVRDYLIATFGVESNRLQIVSHGEKSPLDKDRSPAAWERNRRVDFFKLTR